MSVLTIGTFDLPHYGHANIIKHCYEFSDDVIVGLNTDEFVEQYKGEAPLMTYDERAKALRAFGEEFYIEPNDGAGRELILDAQPDIIVVGSDWARKDYLKQIDMTQDELDELGIAICYVPYTPGISTTELKQRAIDRSRDHAE